MLAPQPCEHNELSTQHPEIVATMVKRLAEYSATAVPPVKGEVSRDSGAALRPYCSEAARHLVRPPAPI